MIESVNDRSIFAIIYPRLRIAKALTSKEFIISIGNLHSWLKAGTCRRAGTRASITARTR